MYGGNDINENILKSFRTNASSIILRDGEATISEFLLSPKGGLDHPDIHTSLYALLLSAKDGKQVEYRGDVISEVFFPIFDSFEDNRHTVAIMTAW